MNYDAEIKEKQRKKEETFNHLVQLTYFKHRHGGAWNKSRNIGIPLEPDTEMHNNNSNPKAVLGAVGLWKLCSSLLSF